MNEYMRNSDVDMSDRSYFNPSQCSHLVPGCPCGFEIRLLQGSFLLKNRVSVTGIMRLKSKAEI
jgi:hypothetical protein